MSYTTDPNDPNDPRIGHDVDAAPVKQNGVYLVLGEEERHKGFVRPLRRSYKHVGVSPKFPLRDLTPEEDELYNCDTSGRVSDPYVKFEEYPEGDVARGKFWTESMLVNEGCGGVISMGLALCETYARDPHFYGSTYCCHCMKHLPVAEFVWEEDGKVVGS